MQRRSDRAHDVAGEHEAVRLVQEIYLLGLVLGEHEALLVARTGTDGYAGRQVVGQFHGIAAVGGQGFEPDRAKLVGVGFLIAAGSPESPERSTRYCYGRGHIVPKLAKTISLTTLGIRHSLPEAIISNRKEYLVMQESYPVPTGCNATRQYSGDRQAAGDVSQTATIAISQGVGVESGSHLTERCGTL